MHFFAFVLIKLVFLAFIITAFVFFMRKRKFCGYSVHDPIIILETRFVNGEITSEEFSRMKEELKQSRK